MSLAERAKLDGVKLWSAAARCRFPLRELARGNFNHAPDLQPASWLVEKRQRVAALQSFAPHAQILPGAEEVGWGRRKGAALPHRITWVFGSPLYMEMREAPWTAAARRRLGIALRTGGKAASSRRNPRCLRHIHYS